MNSGICLLFVITSKLVLILGQLNQPVFIGQNTPPVPQTFQNQWQDPSIQMAGIPGPSGSGGQGWQGNGNQLGQPSSGINQFGQQISGMNTMAMSMNGRNPFDRMNGNRFMPTNRRRFVPPRVGNQFGPNGQMMQQAMVPQQRQSWAPGDPRWRFPSNRPGRETCQRRGCPLQGSQCVYMGMLCPPSGRRAPCRYERGCRIETHFIPFGQTKVVDQCNNVCRCTSREGIAQCTTRRC